MTHDRGESKAQSGTSTSLPVLMLSTPGTCSPCSVCSPKEIWQLSRWVWDQLPLASLIGVAERAADRGARLGTMRDSETGSGEAPGRRVAQ